MAAEINNAFPPSERLFRRLHYSPVWVNKQSKGDATMWFEHLEYPTFSVFRGTYTRPKAVLEAHPRYAFHGLATFRVSDVPAEVQGVAYRVVHCPEEDTGTPLDDAHCEVRAYVDGSVVVDKSKVSRAAITAFRSILGERMCLIKAAQKRPPTPL